MKASAAIGRGSWLKIAEVSGAISVCIIRVTMAVAGTSEMSVNFYQATESNI
jgi:hypothetical protein